MNLLIQLTANYCQVNETWKSLSTLTLHERITYRGSIFARCGDFAKNMPFWNRKTLTRKERQRDYICRMLENNIRPFNYSDQDWENHLSESRLNDHTERSENKNAWMYQH